MGVGRETENCQVGRQGREAYREPPPRSLEPGESEPLPAYLRDGPALMPVASMQFEHPPATVLVI